MDYSYSGPACKLNGLVGKCLLSQLVGWCLLQVNCRKVQAPISSKIRL